MKLYVQRAFICRECGEQIHEGDAASAQEVTEYGLDVGRGTVFYSDLLEAVDAHFTATGHATFRSEDRLIYQPQPE